MEKDEKPESIRKKEAEDNKENIAEETNEQIQETQDESIKEKEEKKDAVEKAEEKKPVKKEKRIKAKKVIETILHKKEKRKLEGEEKTSFKLAYRMKRKKPKFIRQEFGKMKRLEKKWRKPRGIDSKLRVEKKGRGYLVKIGYKKPEIIRNLHPSGFVKVRIFNTADIDKINNKKEAIIIASPVGRKKRNEIIKSANKLDIVILNPRRGE